MAVEWTVMDEIRLLRWVSEYKPVGIHKHFHMMCILERMNHPDTYPVILLQKEIVRTDKQFTARDIWLKLSQYYNLDESDKLENGAFKESTEPIAGMESDNYKLLTERSEFSLPWDEYSELILKNAKRGIVTTEDKNSNNIIATAGETEAAVVNSSPTVPSNTEKTVKEDIKSPSLEVGGITKEEFLKEGATNGGADNNGKVEVNNSGAQPSETADHLQSKNEEEREKGKEVINERISEEPAAKEDTTNVQTATKGEEEDSKHEDKVSDEDTVAVNEETGKAVCEPLEKPLSDGKHNTESVEETTLGTNKEEVIEEKEKDEEEEEESKRGIAIVSEQENQASGDNPAKKVVKEGKKVPEGPTEEDNRKQGEIGDNKENSVKEIETEKASKQHTVTVTLPTSEPKTTQESTETDKGTESKEEATEESRVGKESIIEELAADTVETETKERQVELEKVQNPESEQKNEEASSTEPGKIKEEKEKEKKEGETIIVAEKPVPKKDIKAETKLEDNKPLEVATEETITEPKPTTVPPEEEPSTLTTRVKKRRKRESDIFQASSAIIGGLLDDEPLAKRTRHSSASNSKANASAGTNMDANTSANPKDKSTATTQAASKQPTKGEETKQKKKKKQKSKKNEKRAPARGTRSSSRLRNKKSNS